MYVCMSKENDDDDDDDDDDDKSLPTGRYSKVKVVVESRVASGFGVRLVTSALGRKKNQVDLGQLAAAAVLGRQIDCLADDHCQPLATWVVAELEPY